MEKNSFGALPIQRISKEAAIGLLRKAYAAGVTFMTLPDTIPTVKRKWALPLRVCGTKYISLPRPEPPQQKASGRSCILPWKIKTDYIDIYQFHNPAFCPKPGDGTGLYEAMLEAKDKGMIRHIGITNHRLNVAHEAIDSGLYETLQFPFCYLATDKDLELVQDCKKQAWDLSP